MKISFVGLGQMGKPMAMNLLKSGADLVVHSTSGESYPEFEAKGARTTRDSTQVAQAEVVFLCLPSSEVVRKVLLGEQGLAERLGKGQTVVDTSTITYSTTLEVNDALEARGVAFLDAPVSGMEARAIEGTLTVMCGGKRETFEAVKPYLECLGNNILYMGGPGSGQLTKLINQLLFDINCAALAEILPMAVKMGLDAEKVGAVINSGTGRSYASEFFIPRILEDSFSDGIPHAARLQGPRQRGRAWREARHPDAGAGGGDRHLSDGAAQGAWRARQGRHDPRVRRAAGRRVPQADGSK